MKQLKKKLLASFTQKNNYYSASGSFFLTSSAYKSKFRKPSDLEWNKNVPYIGEDAYFISTLYTTIGVADGIRGWERIVKNKEEFDSSAFSWCLMENALQLTQEDYTIRTPKEIIQTSYDNILENDQCQAGSSTVCVVSLLGSDLYYANLGDSGFMVIRSNKLIYKSKPQQHQFNYPYQLTYISPSLLEDDQVVEQKNDLKKLDTGKIQVQDDDIVILGTDGLFDNLYDSDILDVMKQSDGDIDFVSSSLLTRAKDKMIEKDYYSPFAKSACKSGKPFLGGKIDDITIIVGKVNIEEDFRIHDDDL
eukprot:gene10017-2336_t